MSEHNFVYDPHCSRCGADGSKIDTECPGDTILAAAHRAGAREAVQLLAWEFDEEEKQSAATGERGVFNPHTLYGMEVAYRNAAKKCRSLIAARYAEPGEEKKP